MQGVSSNPLDASTGGAEMSEAEVYYTVRAVQRETNDRDRPQKGDYIWLDWADEGGGWVQWSAVNDGVIQFTDIGR